MSGLSATTERRWEAIARVVAVRLRFPALLAVLLAVVLGWETLSTHFWRQVDRWTGPAADPGSVSSSTEYFCPMDPGVLADWPSKCPICNMTLVRRERGDMAPLPDGVLARVQLTPYRVQLAGISVSEAAFRPIERRLGGPARTIADEPGAVALELFADEADEVQPGMLAEVDPGTGPLAATVEAVEPRGGKCLVRLRLTGPGESLPASGLKAVVKRPAADLPPFRDRPRDPPPLQPGEPRIAYRCPNHPETVREAPGTCPTDRAELVRIALTADRRLRWWCPMHPAVTAEKSGASCDACDGMKLVPRIIAFAPPGQVLAVPESAVIDTGTRRVVYLERMPGVYEAVEIKLGPRCGDSYPVVAGLGPGQRVVTTGAFLVDAETRLSPSLAAAYFGASTASNEPAPPARPSPEAKVAKCPVTGLKLGSMGEPVSVTVRGRTVLLCCAACKPKLEADPDRYLKNLKDEPSGAKAP